jgi:hypothetical protein
LLRFCAAVGDPALLEGADDLREGMTLFALVEPGVAAPAQFRAFKPVEHEQRAFDAPKERGVALLSLVERIDTNSAAGELVFHVFGAIAHFEIALSPLFT